MSLQKLAEFIVHTGYDRIPAEAINISKDIILDTIGISLAGSREDTCRKLYKLLKEYGGQPTASVIGGGFRTSTLFASLANGTAVHVLDYDDLFASLHPSAVIVPAILATAEKFKNSGKEILAAYLIGVETVAKLSEVLGNRHYLRGWHSTSTLGSLSATAAVARLMKLDVSQTKMAIGIAASLTSGLRANFGTMTKPLHAGNAAQNGILAASLALEGFTSSENILTAEAGFFNVFGEESSYNTDIVFGRLGQPFAVVSPGVWLKRYPCAAGNHASVDAILQIRRKYPLDRSKIVEIECATGKQTPKVMIHHRPQTGLQAKFSLEYCVSVALVDGELTLNHFTDEKVLSPEYQEIVPKVKYAFPPHLENTTGPYDLPRVVTVKLNDDTTYSESVNSAKGQPGNPMSREELKAKFTDCAHKVLTDVRITEVLNSISRLEAMPDIFELMKVLAGIKK